MNAARWLTSPLAGTAGVLAGLLVISLPLRKLTSAAPAPPPMPVVLEGEKIQAVLRLKLLAPAKRVAVLGVDGHSLLEVSDAPAGESEHDVTLELQEGGVDVELVIEGAGAVGETAAFLTMMPDGREELTRYAIGEGDFGDVLRFEWPHAR